MVFTNFWKNVVYLFAKSQLVIGQFPPSFIILFLRTCLSFLNSSHSHSKWSAVCGLFLQRHVGSSIILNLWKYDLSFPCPVTIVDKFMHICNLLDIYTFILHENFRNFFMFPSHRDRNIQEVLMLHCKTGWSKSLCAPDDYSTKNTQRYFKQFQSLTMIT
jgi:hypothetical protein